MLKRVALFVVACAFTGQALAALFDDEEARRRIELLRQNLEAQNRSIDERLAKIEQLAGDRSSLLEFASQMEQLRNDVAGMRGQVEVLTNQAETLIGDGAAMNAKKLLTVSSQAVGPRQVGKIKLHGRTEQSADRFAGVDARDRLTK